VLLYDILNKILPPTRTFVLRLTSKTIKSVIENAKVDTIVMTKNDVMFTQDKLNSLNMWCNVTELYLKNCIFEENHNAFVNALCANTTLVKLYLNGNFLKNDIVIAIVLALCENTTLSLLDLNRNKISDTGWCLIATVLDLNSTLVELYLNGNFLRENVVHAIADGLHTNTTLTALDLGNNNMREGGAHAIAEALRTNTTLEKLNLENNLLGCN